MNFGLDLRPSLSKPTGVGSYVLALAQRLPELAPDDRFYFFSASLKERYPHRTWPPNVVLVDRRLPVRALNYAWNRLEWPPMDRIVGAPLDLVHSPHPLLIPAEEGEAHRHPPRPLLPEAPGHDRGGDPARLRAARARPRAPRGRRHLRLRAHRLGGPPAAGRPAGQDRGDPERDRPRLPPAHLGRGGGRGPGPPRAAPRGHPLYRQRREAEEPRQPRHGLHRRWPAAAPACRRSCWSARARTGRRAGTISGPQIRATGYLETREIRALMAASVALVLPSLEEGFGLPVVEAMAAGPARRLLARLRPGGGRGRRGHARQPPRHALDRGRDREDPRRSRAPRDAAAPRARAEPRLRLGHRGRARRSSSTGAC